MDKFINSLPKHVLATFAIAIGILVFFLLNPPHSICDTQEATFRDLQKGNIFSSQIVKKKIPPILARTKESCQLGNSVGACYEYLMSLKKIADGINNSSNECIPQIYEIAEVKSALNDGIEMMVRLAWGMSPPENPQQRYGWLQESEVAVFCRIKSAYIRANGEEAWLGLKNQIFPKLPGDVPQSSTEPQVETEGKKALEVLSEDDVWSRSLFSVRCENI